MQVLLCESHLDEPLPSENIYGASIVNKVSTNVVSHEVYRISADICADDEGVIVWVVLKPEVSFGKCDWDVGPGSAELFAFTHMQDCAEVFLSLPLRLVYRLI